MDQVLSLLNYEGKKSFKKDVHSEAIHVEIYLERSIKWLGLFSMTLAVIAQVMEEVSGTHIKCYPDHHAGFVERDEFVKSQTDLSKAFAVYIDVHCATAHMDYGPLVPNGNEAKYSRSDIDDLAKGTLELPYKRCILTKKDVNYCKCKAHWEDNDKPCKQPCRNSTQPCKLSKPPKTGSKTDYDLMLENKVKYKEKIYHHYFAWYLLMQAICVLLPMHLWNMLFGEKILNQLLKIYECTQTQPADLEKIGKDLTTLLGSIGHPYMTIVFFFKQMYFFCGSIWAFWFVKKFVGYGIKEHQTTRCLMEEYTFVICKSPANSYIWFIYVIDLFVILLILIGAAVNLILLLVNWLTKAYLKRDFLKKLLDKLFEDTPSVKGQLEKLQDDRISDYPFFSCLCQENKHIFSDIYISLIKSNKIAMTMDEEEKEDMVDEFYVNARNMAHQTNVKRRQPTTEE